MENIFLKRQFVDFYEYFLKSELFPTNQISGTSNSIKIILITV